MEKTLKIAQDEIPALGLGTWDLRGKQCVATVAEAIDMGYRHLDTAQMYRNEKEVGEGIKKSGISREELFVVTKVSTPNLEHDRVISSTGESLDHLDMEYVDLLLIHWPTTDMDLRSCLEAMFKLKEEDQVRHVGVSNFSPELVRKSLEIGPVMCNQVEFSPYYRQDGNLAVAKEHDLMLTAYSPLDKGRVSRDPLLQEIGRKHNRTAAQVALRWLLQHGNVSVIPKASGRQHLEENMDLFDFELSEGDIKRINNL